MAACLERGLLVGSAGERTLRITPPLTISADQVDQALSILEEVLA
jgi:4-aminobutyrate aminotransferase-like enzyme